ncbi:MAG: S-layer homology domain-containing protein, partial [Peptococcaceae bacterium]|nr:S-layer homology domain-containing protein [Peptococcaceae bacterium]
AGDLPYAALSKLALGGDGLAGFEFDTETLNYSHVTVSPDAGTVAVIPKFTDGLSVTVNGDAVNSGGSKDITLDEATDITIAVTNAAGESKIYTIVINRAPAEPEVSDKAALNTVIAQAEALAAADYTTGSWAVLQTALNTAKSVQSGTSVTQVAVNDAAASLTSAIAALIPIGDQPEPTGQPEPTETPGQPAAPYKAALDDVLSYIYSAAPNPIVNSVGGEWAVLALARGGASDSGINANWLENLKAAVLNTSKFSDVVIEGSKVTMHPRKYTENERIILALSSIGVDAANYNGWDFIATLTDKEDDGVTFKSAWQGVNGAIFALIALDSGNYLSGNQTIRNEYVDYILANQDGTGWSISGTAKQDMTAMGIQALAPYYNRNSQVRSAVDAALDYLSRQQAANGIVGGTSEGTAQTIVAITALGIDPHTDSRFVKNGYSLIDGLLAYRQTNGSFKHLLDGSTGDNQMATEQAAYALVAYDRFVRGQNRLYDMTDVVVHVPGGSDPVKPTEPAKPVDPEEPEEPGEPTDPTEPVDPGESGEPIDPDPSDPTEPETGEPTEPGEPTGPAEPSEPAEPTEPADTEDPGDPGTPVDPENPGEPTTPGEPTDPGIEDPEPTSPPAPSDNGGNNGNNVSNAGGGGSGLGGGSWVAPVGDGKVSVDYNQSGGSVTLSLPDSTVNNIISSVGGSSTKLASIDLSKASNATAAVLPKEAVTKLADAALAVEIKLPQGSVTLSPEAAKSAAAQVADGNVSLEVKLVAVSSLNPRQQAAVGNAPVYDISLTGNSQYITSFGGGLVTIALPYTLKPGEQAAGVTIWYLDDLGNVQKMDAMYDARTQTVIFTTDHLSKYFITYDPAAAEAAEPWVNPFTDVNAGDWFYGAVAYAHANGLIAGTGDDTFSPQANLTRAMLVTILAREAGVDTDGGETWYSAAVEWGVANGITDGQNMTGDVTREQMAAILYRYAKLKQWTVDSSQYTVSLGTKFHDAGEVSGWALEAVSWANAAGILGGRSAMSLAPAGTATRAEAAAILQRFIENGTNTGAGRA